MLGFRDNATLALTKLRSRRIRLIVTLVVSGLLFTVLVTGSLVVRGTLASLTSFTKDGFTSRFFVEVYDLPYAGTNSDPAIIKRAQAIQKDTIAKKTAEAKRLGIPYDPTTEPPTTTKQPDKTDALDFTQPASIQALREFAPSKSLTDTLTPIAKSYGLRAIYTGRGLGAYSNNSFELTPVVAGKEVKASQEYSPTQDSLASLTNSTQTLDNSLIEPFLLQGATLAATAGGPVPILAPVDAVEKLVGLKPLGPKATAQDKLSRLKDIRQKARNYIFDVCYRNQPAIDLVNLAKQQADDASANKGKATYVAPPVQYAVAAAPCSPSLVAKDTRSEADKQLDAKTEQFKTTFGAVAPQTTILKFRVVGILPQVSYGASAADLGGLVSSLVTSTLGAGWFVSNQAAIANPILSQLLSAQAQNPTTGEQAYVEFNDRSGQKRFLDERMCQPPNGVSDSTDPTAVCRKSNKFFLSPFGNPLAAIYDSQTGFLIFLRWVLLIIAGISAIVMMGTVGKVIADSRKETSVFRAVGAKRLDIAQIYLLYAGVLASMAFGIALIIGLIIASFTEFKLSPSFSVAAVLAFNSPNADKVFHLVGFNIVDLFEIFLFAVATGLISAILPLLTNLRRNPIKDMREE